MYINGHYDRQWHIGPDLRISFNTSYFWLDWVRISGNFMDWIGSMSWWLGGLDWVSKNGPISNSGIDRPNCMKRTNRKNCST